MLEISKRPASEAERTDLRKATQGLSVGALSLGAAIVTALSAFGGLFVAVLTATGVYALSRWFPTVAPINGITAMWIGLGVGTFIGISYFIWRLNKGQGQRRALAQRDLAENQIEVCRVTAGGFARCPAFEAGDDWPACFVEISPHELLYLQGRYLVDAFRDRSFPASEFELARWPYSRITLRARSLSTSRAPERRIVGDEITDEECYVPDDTQVINATWANLPEVLRQLKSVKRK